MHNFSNSRSMQSYMTNADVWHCRLAGVFCVIVKAILIRSQSQLLINVENVTTYSFGSLMNDDDCEKSDYCNLLYERGIHKLSFAQCTSYALKCKNSKLSSQVNNAVRPQKRRWKTTIILRRLLWRSSNLHIANPTDFATASDLIVL